LAGSQRQERASWGGLCEGASAGALCMMLDESAW
jgi:hypothetical protein